jgi:hypothetical protein
MPDISTDIHLKEFSNVRFYPRQRYGPWPHRRESALRDLGKAIFRYLVCNLRSMAGSRPRDRA